MSEAWAWAALLDDGSTIQEADVGTFTAVDPLRVVALELRPCRWLRKPVRVDVPKGARATFFRRREVLVRMGSSKTEHLPSRTVIGWCANGVSVYVRAGDDGRITVGADVEAL